MQAVLCSNGKMSNFMLDVVKNKLLLMLVVNCCDRRNIIMALLPSCNTKEADTLHRTNSKQECFRTFSSCTETNTSCSFRSNSRSILFVENGARWAGTASAELARLVREVS